MSSDFLQVLQGFFSAIWFLLTSFRIPGLNFSPAVMIFGIMSFGLALKLMHGILTMTTNGISSKDRGNNEK